MGCCASTRGGGDGDLGFPDAAVPDPVFTAGGKGDAGGRSHSRSPGQDAGSRNPEAAGGTECWDGHVQEPQLHTKRSVSVVSTPSSAKQLRSPDASVSRVRAGSGRLAVPEEGLGDDGLCEIKLEAVEVAAAVGSAASPMPGAAAPTGSLGARASRSPAHAPHMHAFAPTDVGTADEAPRWLRTPASDSDVLMARRRTLVKRRSPEATSASAGKLVTSSNNAAGKFDVVRDPGVAVYVSDGSPRIVTLHSRMQYRMQHRSSSDSGVHTSSSRSRSCGSSFDLVDARQSSREWASTAVPPGRLVSSGSNAGSAESPSPKLQAAGRRRRSLPRVQMLRADAAADRVPVGPASSSDDASGGDDDLPVTRRRSRSDTPPRMRRRRRGLFVDTTSEPSVSPFAKSNVRVSPASAPQGRPRSGSLGFNTPSGGDGGRRMSRASPASPLSPFGRGRGRGSARGRGAGALRTQGSGSHSVDPLSRVLETRGRSTSAPEMMKPPQGLPVVSKALRGRNASGKIAQVQRPSTVAGRPRRRPRPAPLTPTGIAGRRMSLKLLFKRSHSADVTNFTPEPNQFPDPFANSPDEGLRGVDEADQPWSWQHLSPDMMRRRAAEMTQATRRRRGSTGATGSIGSLRRGSPLATMSRGTDVAADTSPGDGEGESAGAGGGAGRPALPSFDVLEAAAPAHAVHPRLMAAVGGAAPQRPAGKDPVFSSSVCLEFTVGDSVDTAALVDAAVATPSDDEAVDESGDSGSAGAPQHAAGPAAGSAGQA